jgi:hypothetical protein
VVKSALTFNLCRYAWVDEDELLDTPLPGLLDICANLLTVGAVQAECS